MRKPVPTIFAALSSQTSKCEEKNGKVERIDIWNGYVDEHGINGGLIKLWEEKGNK